MRLFQWIRMGALASLLFSLKSWSAEWAGYSAEDLKIGKVARERAYAGGRDEEDLEVQVQSIKPIRKEDAKKENSTAPSSNDDEF